MGTCISKSQRLAGPSAAAGKQNPIAAADASYFMEARYSDDTPANGSYPGKDRISRARPAEAPRGGWVGLMELDVPTAAGTGRAWSI